MRTSLMLTATAAVVTVAVGGAVAFRSQNSSPHKEPTPEEYWLRDKTEREEKIQRWKDAHPGQDFGIDGEIDIWKQERDEALAYERIRSGFAEDSYDHAKDVHQLCATCAALASGINADIVDPLNNAIDSMKLYDDLMRTEEEKLMRLYKTAERMENDAEAAKLIEQTDAMYAAMHTYAENKKTYREKMEKRRAELTAALGKLRECENGDECRHSSSSSSFSSSAKSSAAAYTCTVPPVVEKSPFCAPCADLERAVAERGRDVACIQQSVTFVIHLPASERAAENARRQEKAKAAEKAWSDAINDMVACTKAHCEGGPL